MDRIQPYQPPVDRPTIRHRMERRPAGEDGEGIPLAGLLWCPPRLAYREEDQVTATPCLPPHNLSCPPFDPFDHNPLTTPHPPTLSMHLITRGMAGKRGAGGWPVKLE